MYRILWLTDHYFPSNGGMARSCDRIIHHLRGSGIEIDVIHFTPSLAGGEWHRETRQNGTDLRCSIISDRPHTLNLLWNEIEGQKYTHLVAFGSDTPLLAAPAYSAWLGIPLITLLRGNDFDTGIFSRKKRDVLLHCLEASTAIGAVSSEKTHKVAAMFPGKQVCHTPNGIDLTEWRALPSLECQRNESRLSIGLIGDLKVKKGVHFFIDALRASGLSDLFHLRITGKLSEETCEFLDTAAEDDISMEIHPPVPHSRLPGHYLSCDYVAIPSFYDGMPNVLLEAGGLGVPVIASAVGGITDVMQDETHGFLFRPNDRDECIETLEKLTRIRDAERDQQGENLQKHIADHFTCENERDIFLSLLQSTI